MFESIVRDLSIWGLVFVGILMLRYSLLKGRAVTEPGDQSGNLHKGGGHKHFSEVKIVFEKKEKVK